MQRKHGQNCFYDCDFVNRFVDRRILRAACGRSFLSQQRYEIGEPMQNKHKPIFFQRCTSQDNLAAYEALGESPSNKLLSVLVNARHPIIYSPEARKAFEELPHLYFGLR